LAGTVDLEEIRKLKIAKFPSCVEIYLTIWCQIMQTVQRWVLSAVPESCRICIVQLWPLFYSPAGILPFFLFLFFLVKVCMKKLNPVIYIWGFGNCTGILLFVPNGWRSPHTVM